MQTTSWGTSVGKVFGSFSGMWAAGVAALVCCAFATSASAAGTTPSNVVVKAKAPSSGAVAQIKPRRKARVVADRASLGQRQGLRVTDDPLELKSSVALVMDQDTDEVLISKN